MRDTAAKRIAKEEFGINSGYYLAVSQSGRQIATDESRKPRGRIAGGLDVFERDAIATVIQAWRGEQMRKRVLRQAVPTRTAPVASFLTNLEHVSMREDPQIIHDQNTFPGMEVARRDVVGSVVLGDGDEFLTEPVA